LHLCIGKSALTFRYLRNNAIRRARADGYLAKPFSMEELLLRIEAILRRVSGKKNNEVNTYVLGKFVFDTQNSS
jgi:DNA-binding response OmpR family regulator